MIITVLRVWARSETDKKMVRRPSFSSFVSSFVRWVRNEFVLFCSDVPLLPTAIHRYNKFLFCILRQLTYAKCWIHAIISTLGREVLMIMAPTRWKIRFALTYYFLYVFRIIRAKNYRIREIFDGGKKKTPKKKTVKILFVRVPRRIIFD